MSLFMCADIHDFYYNTPMVDFEYMKLSLSMFPQEIINQYNLKYLVAADGYVYMDIRKGVPGLNQAGKLAQRRTKKEPSKEWICPGPTHTIPLGPPHVRPRVVPSRQQLWNQVHTQGRRRPPDQIPSGRLQDHRGLGRG